MDLIYLDYNCFQRAFDDQRQIRIKLETMACKEIFLEADRGLIKLVWSFMHEDENDICPYLYRRIQALRLSVLCSVKVMATDEVYKNAIRFHSEAKLSPKDSLHLACACHVNSNYLLSCDDIFIKRSKRLLIATKVISPVQYIMGG